MSHPATRVSIQRDLFRFQFKKMSLSLSGEAIHESPEALEVSHELLERQEHETLSRNALVKRLNISTESVVF